MADPIVKLDPIENCRFRDSLTNGIQIVRPVVVTGISFGVGEAAAEVWSKAVLAPGFPLLGSTLTASYPVVLLQRELRGIENFGDTVRGELTYGSPPNFTGDTIITYTITDAFQTSHILTQCSANGSENLYALYKVGGSVHESMDDSDARSYHFSAPKIVTFRTLRATGIATRAQWDPVKADIRASAGTLNSVPWGSDDRGMWLFLGPITRTADYGATYTVQLDFVRAERPTSFYPMGFYYDLLGIHPKDSATESDLLDRLGGPPIYDSVYRSNGASIASIYDEVAWPDNFSFTPDD